MIGLKNNRVATERNLLRTIDQLENYLGSSLEDDPLLLINHYQLQSQEYWKKIKMKRTDMNHINLTGNLYIQS